MNMPLVLLNRRRRGFTAFSPSSLFALAEPGIWLDPSDLSTMFSDRAGTIPVTTPGTVVGKRLDKSGRGNHAVAPTDAARPIYGVEPKGGRRNLLTWSEDFRTTAQAGETRPWLVDGTTITADFGTAPDGTITADRMVTGAGVNSVKLLHQSLSLASGTHTFSVYVKDNGSTARSVAIFFATPTLSATVGTAYNFDTDTLTNDANAAPFTIVSSNRTSVGSGWFRLSVAVTVASAQTVRLYIAAPYAPAQAGNYLIWGAQLELGSTATNYQRVLSAYDITESGVATCHYVQYDGSDDSMSTSAIDFTATDKMSVFAGVRKLSDSAGTIFESSIASGGNNGAILLSNFYSWRSRGTENGDVSSSLAAPTSNVLTGLGDISGDRSTLRINGAQVAQSTADQGTGNYGNYPLFIGRRNNSANPFSGKDYGIIIVGKAASAGEITDTETWLAARTSGVSI